MVRWCMPKRPLQAPPPSLVALLGTALCGCNEKAIVELLGLLIVAVIFGTVVTIVGTVVLLYPLVMGIVRLLKGTPSLTLGVVNAVIGGLCALTPLGALLHFGRPSASGARMSAADALLGGLVFAAAYGYVGYRNILGAQAAALAAGRKPLPGLADPGAGVGPPSP